MRTLPLALCLVVFAMLAGCGTKTPLSKPAGPAKPPLFGATPSATPTTSPAPAMDDSKPATGAIAP